MIDEISLPSGDPLSTRASSGEGPWDPIAPLAGDYPAELLADSDLAR